MELHVSQTKVIMLVDTVKAAIGLYSKIKTVDKCVVRGLKYLTKLDGTAIEANYRVLLELALFLKSYYESNMESSLQRAISDYMIWILEKIIDNCIDVFDMVDEVNKEESEDIILPREVVSELKLERFLMPRDW